MPSITSLFLQVGIDVLDSMLGSNLNPATGTQTGTILCSLGSVNKGGAASSPGTADSSNAEWWQTVGLASRPSNPVGGASACQAVAIRQNDREIVIASRDTRTNSIYGNLAPGETCLFAAGADGKSQGRIMIKDEGSVTLMTTDDNTATGNATFFRIHPTKGMMFVAQWGSFTFDQTGFHVKHAAGFGIDGGAIGGMPAPFSALSSYVKIHAGTAKLDAPQTYLGSGLIGYSPVAWGLATNPLTMPMIPICPVGFGVPCGLFTSNSVRAGMV